MPHSCRQNRLPDSKKGGISPLIIQKRSLLLELRSLALTVIRVKALGADLLSVSGHKVHAPKGVGALFVKKGVRLVPRQYGGEQEKKLRPGTEALPSIAALGAACAEFDTAGNMKRIGELNAYARQELLKIDGVVVVVADSGCNCEYLWVENYVFGVEVEPLCQQLISATANFDAAFKCVCLTLFVECHHNSCRTKFLNCAGVVEEFFFALFKRN